MSEIKRYDMTVLNSFAPDRFKQFGMVESEQGEWVRWEDVQELLKPILVVPKSEVISGFSTPHRNLTDIEVGSND
jgi:hypothetical protein